MIPEAFDITGAELKPGDRVVVAVSEDKSAVMRLGTIAEIKWSRPDKYSYNKPEVKVKVEWDEPAGYSKMKFSTITPHSAYYKKSSRFYKIADLTP